MLEEYNPVAGKVARGLSEIAAPVAQSIVTGGGNMRTRRSGNTGIVISNKELLGNVTGTASSSVPTFTRYSINPGLASVFTWASEAAKGFQYYQVLGLEILYVTRTNTAKVGSIMMAAMVDNSQGTPETEVDLMTLPNSREGSSWNNMKLVVSPAAIHSSAPRKLIRTGLPSGDINLFDACSVVVATLGQGDTDQIGKLYVNYVIRLDSPVIKSVTPISYTVASFYMSGSVGFTSGAETLVPYDTSTYNQMGITNASGLLTLSRGVYLAAVTVTWQNSSDVTTLCHARTFLNAVADSHHNSYDYSAAPGAGTPHTITLLKHIVVDDDSTFGIYVKLTGGGTLLLTGDANCIHLTRFV